MNTKLFFSFTIILTLFPNLWTHAESRSSQKEIIKIALSERDCSNYTNNSQLERCTASNQKATEIQMNGVYHILATQLDSNQRQLLAESQRNWIKNRNKQCEFEAEHSRSVPGITKATAIHYCKIEMNKKRTTELNNCGNAQCAIFNNN